MTLTLQTLHMGAFVCRENARNHLRDAESCGNRPCRALVVTRQHDGHEVHRLHLRDRRRTRRLLRIAHAEEADNAPRAYDDECRLAALCHLRPRRLNRVRERDAELCEESRIARRTVHARHTRTHTLAEHRREIRSGGNGQSLFRSIARNRCRNRVLAALLKRGCKCGKRIGIHPDGTDADELRATLGERARLVHQHRADVPRRLQCLARLDEDAVRRAAPRADHDRNGGCKPQCTGAGDDENGDRDGKCELHRRPHHEPDRARREGNRNHDGDKDRRDAVGKACDGCL